MAEDPRISSKPLTQHPKVTPETFARLSPEELLAGLKTMTKEEIDALLRKIPISELVFVVMVVLGGYNNKKRLEEIENKLETMRDISNGLKNATEKARQAGKDKEKFVWKEQTITLTIKDEKGKRKPVTVSLEYAMAIIADPSIRNIKDPKERSKKVNEVINKMNLSSDPDLALQQINNKAENLGDQLKKVAAEAQKAQSENTTFDETASKMAESFNRTVQGIVRNF